MFCFAPRCQVFLSVHPNNDTRKQSIHKDDRPTNAKSQTVRVGATDRFMVLRIYESMNFCIFLPATRSRLAGK